MHSDASPEGMPLEAAARFGDGKRAIRVAAVVVLTREGLAIRPEGTVGVVWPYADLRVAEPIRGRSYDAIITSRTAGKASIYIDDTLLLAHLIKRAQHLTLRHERWRTVWPGLSVGAAALAAYAGVWAFDISPAKTLAGTMPEKARVALGESVIRTMPSKNRCTGAEGYAALGKLVSRLLPNGPVTAANIAILDLRTAGDKPLINAFAVPGNRLVLTRAIIEQAQSADEIAAIIGHEAGHVIELHPEASLVRSVGFWALVQMVFTGTPGAISNIGVVLAQLSYTRTAEREADGHALRLLREAKISPQGMADFFRRMEKRQAGSKTETKPEPTPASGSGASEIFSSHPSNPERIAFIESQPSYSSAPALTDVDWQALRSICANSSIGPVAARPSGPGRSSADDAAAAAAAKDLAERVASAKAAADRAVVAAKEGERQEAVRMANAQQASAKAGAEKMAADARAIAERVAAEKTASEKADAAMIAAARRETEKAEAARAEADRVAAAKAEAERAAAALAEVEAKRLADAKIAADRAVADAAAAEAKKLADAKIAADKAAADAAAAAAKQRVASATEVPQSPTAPTVPPPVAETPGPTPFDVRIANASQRLAANPNDTVALFERGQAFAAKAELANAVTDFTRVIELRPQDANTIFWRASVYARLNQSTDAIADYTEVIKLQPKNFAAYNNRGSLYKAQKQLDLALGDYTAALAIDGKQSITLTNRALVHREKRNLDLALADLNAAVAANPNYVNAYVRRGETYELKSNRDAAIADYRRAIKVPERGNGSEPGQTARARLAALGAAP